MAKEGIIMGTTATMLAGLIAGLIAAQWGTVGIVMPLLEFV